MLTFWSHEGVILPPSSHFITSSRLPCLGLTDAHWPHLGGSVPLLSKWRPFPQGPRTLPHRGPEQFVIIIYYRVMNTPESWLESLGEAIFSNINHMFSSSKSNLQSIFRMTFPLKTVVCFLKSVNSTPMSKTNLWWWIHWRVDSPVVNTLGSRLPCG